MAEPSPVNFLRDPLSEITRKERRNLLIASTVGIMVSKVGLIPEKISTFGIDLSPIEKDTFVILVLFTIVYFFSAFVIYGVSDFFIWRKQYQDYLEGVETTIQNWSLEDQEAYDEIHQDVPKIGWLYRAAEPVVFTRIMLEYTVPIIFGVYTITTLVIKVC